MPTEAVTPMMAQYEALKAEHPGCLLFFRLGDFYELFFDDAKRAAPALDVTLTRRPQGRGGDVPMCGVPAHALEVYLHKLIREGFKVAICEQVETPEEARRRAGAKGGPVRREVVRVVTPGTLTEDGLLEARRNNHLLALLPVRAGDGHACGLAWLDLSTGRVRTRAAAAADLASVLAEIEPGETLVPDAVFEDADLMPALREAGGALTPLPAARFDPTAGGRSVRNAYGVATLDAFGAFGPAEIGALGALLGYVETTRNAGLAHLTPPRRVEPDGRMAIDAATRRNLELLAGADGGRKGGLLAAVDRTVTGAGGRRLAARLGAPLAKVDAIEERLDRVAALVGDPAGREAIRDALRGCPDLERALARLCLGRGGPRDLGAVRLGLARAAVLAGRLAAADPPLRPFAEPLRGHDGLIERLAALLADELPALARDGGLIRPGASAELDEQRTLRDDGRRRIAALQARYQAETGIPSLKIRHNNLIGYHVEVPEAHARRVPEGFVRRQGMANATRYATAELSGLAAAIAGAADRAAAIERALFEELAGLVRDHAAAIGRAAGALAGLDATAGLAELAAERRYVRPVMTDDGAFVIRGGRHPVVEQALADDAEAFVPNDADLSPDRRLWLLTGPNMAGKSTFLRQNALIAVLAQAGGFVPADEARIGVVDRLFSRVGAADDLARGRSTFMVEMVETAVILNRATERSLVILDEIGRGTATFDGLSIAWAVVEHLHDAVRCRGLFATHYHELTDLARHLPRLACRAMRVREWKGAIAFLHEVGEGGADRSYGLHVARLAGLPAPVLRRAEHVLKALERGDGRKKPGRVVDELPLFAAARPAEPPPPPTAEPHPLTAALDGIRPDELSPREALEALYRLKGLAAG